MIVQEGWSLAECFSIRCIVAAPYVVPYRYLRSSFPFCIINYQWIWIQLCLFCVEKWRSCKGIHTRVSPNIWDSEILGLVYFVKTFPIFQFLKFVLTSHFNNEVRDFWSEQFSIFLDTMKCQKIDFIIFGNASSLTNISSSFQDNSSLQESLINVNEHTF